MITAFCKSLKGSLTEFHVVPIYYFLQFCNFTFCAHFSNFLERSKHLYPLPYYINSYESFFKNLYKRNDYRAVFIVYNYRILILSLYLFESRKMP